MAETFTKQDMDMAASRLAVEAQMCGLLDSDETLYYTNGSTGVSATLEIKKVVNGEWQFRAANWIPKFTPKDNKRTQNKMIYAAAEALKGASRIIDALRANAEDAEADR